jgi:hypothetical protein
MANLNFTSDLKLGNDGEMVIIEYLLKRGSKLLDTNDDNKYDARMVKDGVETTYEIKTDVKCAPLFDTGNIFIEYESRGKASGISVTEADWFVTYFKYLGEVWFIKTKNLKKLIEENNFPTFKDAGDVGSATHGYLIKRKEFKDYFYVRKI